MKYKNIFCFSGQGSNYYNIGKDLYNHEGTFRKWMEQLDEIAKPLIMESILSIMYNDNKNITDIFDRTLYTHPAIFMIEYSFYKYLIEKKIYPDYVLGFSLGEFTSAAIAGIMTYEEALKIIIKHAEIIEKKCEKSGMLAILHDLEFFDDLQKEIPYIELSSINSNNHFVISGPNESLGKISYILKEKGIINQLLPVSYAFHSSLIDPAAEDFKNYLRSFNFNAPSIPYISCEKASFINDCDIFRNNYFWDITRNPILLKDTIVFIEKIGDFNYIDLGPSGTAINFVKMNLSGYSNSKLFPSFTPFGVNLSNISKLELNLMY